MIALHVTAGADAAATLQQVKLAAKRFPGHHRLKLIVAMANGEERHVTLGYEWRYEPSLACLAALGEFGEVEVV